MIPNAQPSALATEQRPARGRARVVSLLARVSIGVVLAVVITVLGLAYREASVWTFPERHLPDATPAVYGIQYEDVGLVTEDGLHLVAWYVPSANGATIVMIHGLHGQRGGDLELARDLVARGYGLFLPDLRAHGESEGTTTSLGLYEVRDIRAAVNYLKGRSDVDPERLGVYGASLGGSVAIMSAAELPELKAVAVDSSFASLAWLVQNQFSKLEGVPTWLGPVVLAMGGLQARMNPADVAPVDRIGRISPRPVLIMHGDLDEKFLPDNARLLASAAGEPKELWIGPGVRHTRLYATDPAAYVERVAGFFDRALLSHRGGE